MLKKLLAALAALLATVTLTAAPAQAAPLQGCADNAICLYQWTGYGASKWQSSFYNLSIQTNDCVNLTSPPAYWASDGQKVWDNSGSMVINATGSYGSNVYLTVYDWANCNNDGSFNSYPANMDTTLSNLSNYQWQTGDMYHRITSIRIRTL